MEIAVDGATVDSHHFAPEGGGIERSKRFLQGNNGFVLVAVFTGNQQQHRSVFHARYDRDRQAPLFC